MSISIEIVDATTGRPAMGAIVTLLREDDAEWCRQTLSRTDDQGRAVLAGLTLARRHRLSVDLDEYFAGFGITPVQSRIEVTFRVFHCDAAVRLLVTVTASSCATHALLTGSAIDLCPPAPSLAARAADGNSDH